jgi:peptidyl-prolyl cis-trans isomerase B (cyclophilin B)
MASSQRFAISLLLVFTVLFAFLAQSAQATRGPKITHKVRLSVEEERC